jgi:hypothetical protein
MTSLLISQRKAQRKVPVPQQPYLQVRDRAAIALSGGPLAAATTTASKS